jgi:surface protein
MESCSARPAAARHRKNAGEKEKMYGSRRAARHRSEHKRPLCVPGARLDRYYDSQTETRESDLAERWTRFGTDAAHGRRTVRLDRVSAEMEIPRLYTDALTDYTRGVDDSLDNRTLRLAVRELRSQRTDGVVFAPIGQWDVSRVTNFEFLFREWPEFNEPIGEWDVSRATTMRGMFCNCRDFNQPIGNWDVSRVKDFAGMFNGASSFNQPIGEWTVSRATCMRGMFRLCDAFNQPIGNWDVSNVRDMGRMFQSASAFNRPLLGWKVGRVVSFQSMFESCRALNVAFVWNAPSVVITDDMFKTATAMNRGVIFNTPALRSAVGMFAGATAMRHTVRLDMSSVTAASEMFVGCPDEAKVDASSTESAIVRRQLGSRLLATRGATRSATRKRAFN